jgi:hypothetical protein
MHIRTHLKNPKIIIAGCITLGSATPSSEGMMSIGGTGRLVGTHKTSSYQTSIYQTSINQTSIYQTSSYRMSRLQNVQVTKRPGYRMYS